MKSWKTTISAAVTVTGSALSGIGGLVQLNQLNPKSKGISDEQLMAMWYVMLVGVVMAAVGKGLGLLFAADADVLKEVAQQANANTVQIADTQKTVDKMNDEPKEK